MTRSLNPDSPEYTEAQKDAAIDRASAAGASTAAKETGINRSTIWRWMKERDLPTAANNARNRDAVAEVQARAAEVRARVGSKLLVRVEELLDRMTAPYQDVRSGHLRKFTKPPANAAKDLAIAAAVLIDKYRLEMGEATTRGEHRDLTGDDHESEALRDAIKRELSTRRDGDVDVLEAEVQEAGAAPGEALERPAEAGTDGAALAPDETTGAGGPVG